MKGTKKRVRSTSHVRANKQNLHRKKTFHSQFRLVFIAVLIIAFYLVGYAVSAFNKPKLSIEIVRYGTIETVEDYTGIIIRDEQVVYANESGMALYNYTDNEFVKKGKTVCIIRNTDVTEMIENKIAAYNQDILNVQEDRGDLSIFSDDVQYRNAKIDEIVDEYRFINDDPASLPKLKQMLQKEVDLRNQMLLGDSQSSVKEMVEARDVFAQQLAAETDVYTAATSGTLVLNIDGLEDTITPETMMQLTPEQTKMSAQLNEQIVQERIVQKEDPLFKIVTSNKWYVAAYLPVEPTMDWEALDFKTIFVKTVDGIKEMDVRIHEISKKNDQNYVIFETNKYMSAFIDARSIQFRLSDEQYDGIKIPNTAIAEKTLLSVPDEWIIEQKNAQGVYKKAQNDGYDFVVVNVTAREEGQAFIAAQFGNIGVGDTIYLPQDEGGAYEAFVITQTRTHKGVYTVNTGMAEFRAIDIIAANDYYSIIGAQNLYGVKPYDRIISDVHSLDESQLL